MKEIATFNDLKNTSVFITGGGSGIGAALTEGFLQQGARVAFVQRSDAILFCDEMEAKHDNRPLFMQCDITDIDALKACIDHSATVHGSISTLINNAANDERHTTAEVDSEYWDRMIAINFKSYFFACQAVITGMQTNGGGSIINFSSISYMMGNSGFPVYTGSNSGINGMTRSLAREFGPSKIRVNVIAPGWVLTEKQLDKWATPDGLAAHMDRQSLKEHLKPSDIVGAALFLASGASRMMTGQSMVVDGGVVVTG